MTENEPQCRITFFEALFQVVRHAKKRNFDILLTGDESQFYSKYIQNPAWAASRGHFPSRPPKRIGDHSFWLPQCDRHPDSTVFLHYLPICGTMQSVFKHLFFLTSRETYSALSAENALRYLSASPVCTTWQHQTVTKRNYSNQNYAHSPFS
jgi:hypothetical protein